MYFISRDIIYIVKKEDKKKESGTKGREAEREKSKQ